MAPYDPFTNYTAILPRVRHWLIAGGAAGALTLTGINQRDRLLSVFAVPVTFTPAGTISQVTGTNTAIVTGEASGAYTVVAGDDTAGTKAIATGLTAIDTFRVQIRRAGVDVSADAIVSASAGTLTVADGGATYALTAGDVIHWWARDASDAVLTAVFTGSTPTFTGTAGTPAVTVANLTSEFTITAANTINNTGGTATVGDLLLVSWYDEDLGETTNPAHLDDTNP